MAGSNSPTLSLTLARLRHIAYFTNQIAQNDGADFVPAKENSITYF
jgi:hypothetical protein